MSFATIEVGLLVTSMDSEALKYIVVLTNPPLIVCKQCQHAIWPKEIRRYYHGDEHDLSIQIISRI